MTSVLIKNVTLPWGERSDVSVIGNKIAEIGRRITGEHEHVVDGTGCLLIPGLVNTHTHAAMTGFRGIADDMPLQEWLENHIWPAEKENVNPEFVYWNTLLACVEMLRSGTTGFVDMYFHEDRVMQASEKAGIRVWAGEGILGLMEPVEETLEKTRTLLKKKTELANVIVTPHSVYGCNEEELMTAKEFALERGLLVQIHAAENIKEVKEFMERTGMRPVEFLHSIGFLDEKTILAHGVWVTDQEIMFVREDGASVSYNPESNAKLGSGVAPVVEYAREGVNVTIGTDGCASNNNLDMIQEMRTALFLQKVLHKDPACLKAEQAFKMATENAYSFLELNAGLFEGAVADLVLVSLKKPHMQPVHDALSNLVYSGSGSDVVMTMVNGKIVYDGENVLGVDEQEVLEKVKGFWE